MSAQPSSAASTTSPPALAPAPASAASTPASSPADPYLWLEEVQGERALAWVKARNRESESMLMAQPGFEARRQAIREVLDSREQIPYVARRGDWFYNLWRDAANPRGLWRRTTLAEYRKPSPAWQTVLDIDALGKTEGENWVWAGAQCLGPSYRRCLVSLSRGGADASVVREFNTDTKTFVDGGFSVPEAKTSIEWLDADTVYIASDFGPGSMTDSGYPRIVKRWRRGQPLAAAETVFSAQVKDVSAFVTVDLTPGFERTVVGRSTGFYTSEQFLLLEGIEPASPPRIQRINMPDDADLSLWRDKALLNLRSAWTMPAGTGQPAVTWRKGSLLVTSAADILAGKPASAAAFTALFTPTQNRSLAGYTTTRDTLLLNLLDQVASRLEVLRYTDKAWTRRAVAAPYPGQLSVTALHDPLLREDLLAESYFLNAADFLTPDSLQLRQTGNDSSEKLKSRPSFFDASGMRVEQRFATSKDGTRVPYFVVWPKGALAAKPGAVPGSKPLPTLLYGYGGFEVSLGPWYSGSIGRAWTSQGGVFVVANIRGGGEFGPAWHQAAILQHKQTSYDDFAAVAEDLIAQGITTPAKLGIQGGSNGGLLVGAVMLQRPELFGAVVSQVPLLDMRRYHQLLAGASWMAEYGDPDQATDWAFISRYSPFQNVKASQKLPPVLFTTSTRDDRVHPGHARKMAARMLEQGHPVLYWENLEGGHGGAADNGQRATMQALEYSFLCRALGGL